MKKVIAVIALAIVTLMSSNAQTIISSTNPPANLVPTNSALAVTPFINTLGNWVTSFNESLYWTNEIAIDTGVATTTGQKVSDRLELVYNTSSFEFGASANFTGVGSAFDQAEALVGYDLVNKYDFRFAIELGAGYDWNKTDSHGAKVGAIVIDPEVAAYKKITQNTYATIKYGFPIETVGKFNNIGVFYVGAGFTF